MNIQTYATELEIRAERFAHLAERASTDAAHFGFTIASELYAQTAELLQTDSPDPATRLAIVTAFLHARQRPYETTLMNPKALEPARSFHYTKPYVRLSERPIVSMYGPALGILNAMLEELPEITGESQ